MNPHDPAFPSAELFSDGSINGMNRGLTIRAHFAGLAMQAILPCQETTVSDQQLASWSVELADALIAELNKPTP